MYLYISCIYRIYLDIFPLLLGIFESLNLVWESTLIPVVDGSKNKSAK